MKQKRSKIAFLEERIEELENTCNVYDEILEGMTKALKQQAEITTEHRLSLFHIESLLKVQKFDIQA